MTRHPPLQGGVNFRDFGGYATADGGRVKRKKLYRSGHLAGLTTDDHAHVDELGIDLVCDFRTDWEDKGFPTRLPAHIQQRVVRFNIWPKTARTAEAMVEALIKGTASEAEIYESQNVVYREFIRDFAPAYAEMFRHIVAAKGRPVLIHCAGGKDRTGVGAALIKIALGVPEDAVHEDYLLTNQDEDLARFIYKLAEKGAAMAGVSDKAEVDAAFTRFSRLFGARTDSLRAAFEAIHAQAGSFDGYLRDALKLDDADREKLRGWYLE
ncbi:MAG: tyrosine-protein phosphatase [Rhodospirillaceae bacterium]|nr:tyrosine-protein phosphatase [Rhodospirillaceae bacterium]